MAPGRKGSAGQSLSYAWSFGDGSTATGSAPAHSYAAVGSYSVTLTVLDSSGVASTAKTTATIDASPSASAGGPHKGTSGAPLKFNDSNVSVVSADPVSGSTGVPVNTLVRLAFSKPVDPTSLLYATRGVRRPHPPYPHRRSQLPRSRVDPPLRGGRASLQIHRHLSAAAGISGRMPDPPILPIGPCHYRRRVFGRPQSQL